MTTNLRIAIDPKLTQESAAEIHWTWRLLLTGIGWGWEEVPLNSDCDVAYVIEPNLAPAAKLCIQANPTAWEQPDTYRLARVGRYNGLAYPTFEGEPVSSLSIQTGEGRLVCERDLVFDVYWLATGQEERHWPQNQHGIYDLTGTAMLNDMALRQALASQIMGWLEENLQALGCLPPQPRWPHGKSAAATVGHDVDYPEVKRWLEPLRIIMRQGAQGVGPALGVITGRRHHWQFPAWVELEKSLQSRSAFYFVPRQGSLREYASGTPDPFYDVASKKFQELFEYLHDEGFEVGLHASYLAYQSKEKFAAEKEKLEAASGQPVVGNRHHYWHLNPNEAEETLLIHEQIGLKYDASLFHDRYLGWRRGLLHPFFPFHLGERRELKTLQIPTGWMDDQVFNQQAENPGDRLTLLRDLADQVAKQGGCFMIDVHDYVFDEALFPGWSETYARLWEYMLEQGDFWFGTPAEIAEHWINRYNGLVQNSQGLNEGTV